MKRSGTELAEHGRQCIRVKKSVVHCKKLATTGNTFTQNTATRLITWQKGGAEVIGKITVEVLKSTAAWEPIRGYWYGSKKKVAKANVV